MHIHPFRAIYPDEKLISSSDAFFKSVKKDFPKYLKNGFYNKSAQESFYLYQVKKGDTRHLGLLAAVHIQDYIDGNIKVHEATLSAKEQKSTELLLDRQAMIKPVLLSYPQDPELQKLLLQIKADTKHFLKIKFESDESSHKIWLIKDGDLQDQIRQHFENIPQVYIADGHHRTAVTAHLYEMTKGKETKNDYSLLFAAFFAFEELEIHDYNRIVEALGTISPTRFMARLSSCFDIQELKKASKPTQKHQIHLFIKKEWYQLEWKSEVLARYKDKNTLLDADLLNKHVLQEIIGIEDVREDARVTYVEGPKGTEAIEQEVLKEDQKVGFVLFPVQKEEFIQVSDDGDSLPPKSTWFEPRMKNGVIVQSL